VVVTRANVVEVVVVVVVVDVVEVVVVVVVVVGRQTWMPPLRHALCTKFLHFTFHLCLPPWAWAQAKISSPHY